MALYQINEGSFELPDLGLVDRTVNVFEGTLEDGGDVGLLVCRTRIPRGKSLRDVVTAHVNHEAKRLSGYTVLSRSDAEWAGAPGIDVRSRWRHEGKVVYQRQAHMAADHAWLLFAMSAPLSEKALCDESMDKLLASLVLREMD